MIAHLDDAGLLRARAKRRQPRRLLGTVVLTGLAVVLGTQFGPFGPPPSKHHGHNSTAVDIGLIVGGMVFLVAGAAVIVWLVRAARRDEGLFSPPLALGLPWRQRRAVNRAVRRGTPSADPLRRAAEIDAAQRLLHGPQRRAGWVLPAVGLFELAIAVPKLLHGPLGLGILLCVGAFFMFWASAYQLAVLTPGARQLLATEHDQASRGSDAA